MKVQDLITKLQELESRCGNVEVQTYSEDYYCDLHKIETITDGWYNGWREHNGVIGICITK